MKLDLRSALWVTGCAPLLPNLVGSGVNIWYNITHIEPLLTPSQHDVFVKAVIAYNLAAYLPLTAIWVGILLSLRAPLRQAAAGATDDPERLVRVRRRVINLPWWSVVLGGAGWGLSIPVLLIALARAPGPLDPRLYVHIPISVGISGTIAVTHGFFIIELLSQRLLYPVFFRDERPWATPGALALTLRARGLLWAIDGQHTDVRRRGGRPGRGPRPGHRLAGGTPGDRAGARAAAGGPGRGAR
jgi:adenylate cyclase